MQRGSAGEVARGIVRLPAPPGRVASPGTYRRFRLRSVSGSRGGGGGGPASRPAALSARDASAWRRSVISARLARGPEQRGATPPPPPPPNVQRAPVRRAGGVAAAR